MLSECPKAMMFFLSEYDCCFPVRMNLREGHEGNSYNTAEFPGGVNSAA